MTTAGKSPRISKKRIEKDECLNSPHSEKVLQVFLVQFSRVKLSDGGTATALLCSIPKLKQVLMCMLESERALSRVRSYRIAQNSAACSEKQCENKPKISGSVVIYDFSYML